MSAEKPGTHSTVDQVARIYGLELGVDLPDSSAAQAEALYGQRTAELAALRTAYEHSMRRHLEARLRRGDGQGMTTETRAVAAVTVIGLLTIAWPTAGLALIAVIAWTAAIRSLLPARRP